MQYNSSQVISHLGSETMGNFSVISSEILLGPPFQILPTSVDSDFILVTTWSKQLKNLWIEHFTSHFLVYKSLGKSVFEG